MRSREPSRVRRHAYWFLASSLAAFMLVGAGAHRVEAAPHGAIAQVGTLEVDQTGVTAPAGIAFNPGSKTFHLLQSAASASGETEVAAVDATHSVSGRQGTDRIGALVSDPINVAFDPEGSRLLLVSQSRELVEVRVTANGRLVPGSLSRRKLDRLGIIRPRGLAVDPATGAVFVLDAARGRGSCASPPRPMAASTRRRRQRSTCTEWDWATSVASHSMPGLPPLPPWRKFSLRADRNGRPRLVAPPLRAPALRPRGHGLRPERRPNSTPRPRKASSSPTRALRREAPGRSPSSPARRRLQQLRATSPRPSRR